MACEECADLNTHKFRGKDDLVHALQVAATETDRGALQRIDLSSLTREEQLALRSAITSGALPEDVLYHFRCAVCGDVFELQADMEHGTGYWRRNDEDFPPEKGRR